MNRSLWPEGVEVHQIDLVRDTQNTIDGILSRYVSTNVMGVVSGLSVTPSDTNQALLNISSGVGYSSNGQLVAVTTPQINISLADATLGAINYVLAIYTEVYTAPQAHEDLGTTLPTAAVGSYRIAVLTESQWNALPISDPNLNNNSRDRSVILAIVTGTGGLLAQGNIQSPPAYQDIKNVTQPTSLLTGVYVNGVYPTTPIGTGSLLYTHTIGGRTLAWKAPDDATYGSASANITKDTTITLTSSTSEYTITVTITFIDLSLIHI